MSFHLPDVLGQLGAVPVVQPRLSSLGLCMLQGCGQDPRRRAILVSNMAFQRPEWNLP